MANKSNEATPQRPEGDRLLDAPLVTMDLIHLVGQVRNEPSWKDSDRNSITVYKSGNLQKKACTMINWAGYERVAQ